jgi:hypothetical protein
LSAGPVEEQVMVLVSQNGWPLVKAAEQDKLRQWTIPGQTRNIVVPMLPGPPGFVLVHWAVTFDREIEDLEATRGDDFGHSYRPIAGSSEWSNHASATAVDLNAGKHPQGRQRTFSADQLDVIGDRLAGKYRSVIRGGYTFRTTVDDMHWELSTGRILVRELAEDLFDTPRGETIREANPWMEWTPRRRRR